MEGILVIIRDGILILINMISRRPSKECRPGGFLLWIPASKFRQQRTRIPRIIITTLSKVRDLHHHHHRQIVKMHPSMHWAEPAVQVVPLFRAQCTRSIYLVKTFFSFFHQQQPLKSSSLQANFGNWKWQGRKGDITDLSLAEEIEEYALWVRYTIDLLGLYWFALWHKKLLAEMTDPQSKNTTF